MTLNGYYQHRDGGIYEFEQTLRYSDRDGLAVHYIHIWPFEVSGWVRPIDEFTDGRFAPIDWDDALKIIRSMSQEEGQAMANSNKAKRKGTA